MRAVGRVERCWFDLTTRLGCTGPAAVSALAEIVAAYGEPHRHYHTLEHIAALLALLEHHAEPGNDRDCLVLAILLHDVVYVPGRQDNEEASARQAATLLAGLGAAQELVTNVARCILATRHDQAVEEAGDDPDIALLLDLDLSILAAAPDVYRAYAQAIRREYAFVPDTLYGAGRHRLLEAFLSRQRIFLTPRLRHAWEGAARANIARELAELA